MILSKIVNEANPKLNKSWVDQGRQGCKNVRMQEWLDNNDI